MVAFLTGGTGFIGSFVAERLAKEGWQVKCLVRKTSSLKWLENVPVHLVHGDLFAPDTLADALREATHVIHLAGLTKALTSEEYFRANSVATHSLLKGCSLHAPRLQRFVFVSSIAAAGPSLDGAPVREADEPHPISIYGRSKLAGETACHEFATKLPIAIVRPPVVYGPRDRDVYEYFKQVKLGIRLRPGRQERWASLIHVYDLVQGLLATATHPKAAGETYFLTNPEPYEWSGLGAAISRAVGRKSISITVPAGITPLVAAVSELVAKITRKPALLNFDKIREMQETRWIFSGEKAKTELGFETSLSLEEGLRITVEWYRENGWL